MAAVTSPNMASMASIKSTPLDCSTSELRIG